MWGYSNFWGFNPPVGGGPPIGGGQYPTTNQNLPWWAYLGEATGAFDWVNQAVFGGGGNGYGGGQPQGNPWAPGGGTTQPTAPVGLPANFVSDFVKDNYKPGSADRSKILAYYAGEPSLIQRFTDWLTSLGLVASIGQRLLTGDIMQWPMILQDLIILYFHNQPKAQELAPPVVNEANQKAGQWLQPGTYPGGGIGALDKIAPSVLPVVPKMVATAPRGYVVVTDPASGQKLAVRKELARAAGLYKPRAKAPIKASEWKAAKKAKQIETKLSRMLSDSCNFKVTKKR